MFFLLDIVGNNALFLSLVKLCFLSCLWCADAGFPSEWFLLGLSRSFAVNVPFLQVTAIEPISSDGGASISTRHLHQSLRWLFGVAAVATDVGHVLLVDLCLDDLSCSQNEVEASGKLQLWNLNLEVRNLFLFKHQLVPQWRSQRAVRLLTSLTLLTADCRRQ